MVLCMMDGPVSDPLGRGSQASTAPAVAHQFPATPTSPVLRLSR